MRALRNASKLQSQSPRTYATLGAQYGKQHLTGGIHRITDLVLDRGSGAKVWSADGREYLDFTSGIAVTNLGHSHPAVVKAAQEQLGKITHAQVGVGFHEPMLRLIEKLLPKVQPLDSFFFWNSGAEAIEAALKVARISTGRPNIITMRGGYHGRTVGTMAMTNSKTVYMAGFGPLMPNVHVAPFPYYSQLGLPADTPQQTLSDLCIKQFEDLLEQSSAPRDTAAVFIEPILGEGGYVPAPVDYLKRLHAICQKHGILLVVDEIQSGFARSGTFFAYQQYGIVPDIIVMSKGLANGLPLSAIASTKKHMDVPPPGSMGGTFAGNVVACAAGVAVVETIEKENILANVHARSKQLFDGIQRICVEERLPVSELRGRGLLIGLQFADDLAHGTTAAISKAAADKGLLLMNTSKFETLRFMPPLIVSAAEVDQALDIFRGVVRQVLGDKKRELRQVAAKGDDFRVAFLPK